MRRYLAELIGTFVLRFGGVGTAVLAGDKVGYLGVAFAFELTLLTMACAIGPVSGCHIDPAVTVGFLVVRKISPRDAAGYIAGQVIGGVTAAAVAAGRGQEPARRVRRARQRVRRQWLRQLLPTGYHLGGVIVVEISLTAMLVFTVMACTDKIAVVGFAVIPIGLTRTLIHLISIPVDNTSVNPARSIGPAGTAALSQLWLFIVMPLVGGIIGALAYRALFTGAPPWPQKPPTWPPNRRPAGNAVTANAAATNRIPTAQSRTALLDTCLRRISFAFRTTPLHPASTTHTPGEPA